MTPKHNFLERVILFSFFSPALFHSCCWLCLPPSACQTLLVHCLTPKRERETEQGARRDKMTQRKRERERTAKSRNLVSWFYRILSNGLWWPKVTRSLCFIQSFELAYDGQKCCLGRQLNRFVSTVWTWQWYPKVQTCMWCPKMLPTLKK